MNRCKRTLRNLGFKEHNYTKWRYQLLFEDRKCKDCGHYEQRDFMKESGW